MKSANLARLGGIANLSLFFLPLSSCGDNLVTGAELLFEVENNVIHKGILLIALVTAVLAMVVANARTQLFAGTAGVVAIALVLAAGLMGRKENVAVYLRLLPVLAISALTA